MHRSLAQPRRNRIARHRVPRTSNLSGRMAAQALKHAVEGGYTGTAIFANSPLRSAGPR